VAGHRAMLIDSFRRSFARVKFAPIRPQLAMA
jgi:hypothetical protein